MALTGAAVISFSEHQLPKWARLLFNTSGALVRSVAVQMSVLLSFALGGCFNMGAGNCRVAALCCYSLMHTGEDWWVRRLPWTVVTSLVASWRGVRAGDSSVDPVFRLLGHVCQHLQIQPACWDQMLKSFRALCWAHSYGAWKHIGWECADASHCWNWRNTLVTASPFPDHYWLFIWLASALSSLFQPISFFLSQTTDWSW